MKTTKSSRFKLMGGVALTRTIYDAMRTICAAFDEGKLEVTGGESLIKDYLEPLIVEHGLTSELVGIRAIVEHMKDVKTSIG